MRIAGWIFVVSTVLGLAGVFLPSVEPTVAGVGLGTRTSLSLYQLNSNRERVRRMIASYHRAPWHGLGQAVAGALIPKLGRHLGGALDDTAAAAATLDEVRDADVATAATVLRIVLWVFLALQATMLAIMFGQGLQARPRTRHIVGALVMSVLVTALAIALRLVLDEVVVEANDELGAHVVRLGVGAVLTQWASIAGLVAIVAALALHVRHGRRRANSSAPAR